ncbi:MAG: Cache 3/Cache 2 fusion domain-containing protein [Trichlorobacter sp.]|nr:Cache 3/Cache 2 fusion domain-containing protein [Trichlorobacter sp.]
MGTKWNSKPLKWQLLSLVLPLVITPIIIVALVIGFIANLQAYRGITQTSKDDLQHMVAMTRDLLDVHNNHYPERAALQNLKNSDAGEEEAFEALKERIKNKQVGVTGYIFCMDTKGNLTLHREAEGSNIYDAQDSDGFHFIQQMCRKKNGWIRYPWQNVDSKKPRMKIVHYEYYQPWDWIVAVGSYEDEFYSEANKIKARIFYSMIILVLVMAFLSAALVAEASSLFTRPITHMIDVIRRVKQGNLEERMTVEGQNELAEMAAAFNQMTEIIRHNKEMEASLAQQGKMASLGVLSSGVAHEINNPLGVILGYASYIESKISADDPHYKYIHEIKRESKRCKKIVQDLLSYARTPRPALEPVNLNQILSQIIDFAANHTDMRNVTIIKELSEELPLVMLDGDQMRQVAINLILNAGGAMSKGGELCISTALLNENQVVIRFRDTGSGISAEDLEKIFEPFYTTKERGTGLGLAITRQIIERHHGTIEITSTKNKGTSVQLTLPIKFEEI